MFPIVRVDKRRAESVEPLGAKRKFWYSEGNRRILFKAEERGTGEDWAEKIACHLCKLLGLPHVHYELAEEYDGDTYIQPGVICDSCTPRPLSLVLGNQLLLERDPAYPAATSQKYKVSEHTVQAVAESVRLLAPPSANWLPNIPTGVESALDVFVGYLMLDAWVANQDRHHQNWAAIRGDTLRLAPTFDHGASLARNLSDEERKDRLTTKDVNRKVKRFAERALSAFYGSAGDKRALSTLDAFVAFAGKSPTAAQRWLERLAAVDRRAIKSILDEVPNKRMSKITNDFTLELLLVNQDRLLKEMVQS